MNLMGTNKSMGKKVSQITENKGPNPSTTNCLHFLEDDVGLWGPPCWQPLTLYNLLSSKCQCELSAKATASFCEGQALTNPSPLKSDK